MAADRSRPARPVAGCAFTVAAPPRSAPTPRPALHLEELGFLVLEQVVDGLDVPVGDLLELLLRPHHLVLARVAVPGELVERVLGVPAHVPDRNARLLGLVPGDLDVLPAALLGELRENDADDRAVVR